MLNTGCQPPCDVSLASDNQESVHYRVSPYYWYQGSGGLKRSVSKIGPRDIGTPPNTLARMYTAHNNRNFSHKHKHTSVRTQLSHSP